MAPAAKPRGRRDAMMRDTMKMRRGKTEDEDDEDEDEETDGLTPRSAHVVHKRNAEQLMLHLVTHLDKDKVLAMFEEWLKFDSSVEMQHFVRIVKDILPSFICNKPKDGPKPPKGVHVMKSEHMLVRSLIELFNEVDVNGDGDVEWEEFTRFIVEKATLFKEQNELERIPDYSHVVVEQPRAAPYEDPRMTRKSATPVVSTFRHRNLIDKIVRISDQHMIAVTEQHSSVVSVYDARSGQLSSQAQASSVPLAIDYVESQQSLLVACSDMTMTSFVLAADRTSAASSFGGTNRKRFFKEKSRWPTPDTVMSLCWAESQQLAYAGATSGVIQAWHLGDREIKSTLKGHTDIVMEVLHAKYLDNIISASLDKTVRVWDPYTEMESMTLLGHTKGVSSLTYNAEHRFLISAGFDHDAFVWSPFVSTLLRRLKGHRAALVGCHAVDGTHELLTADCSGIIKLWDLRNFQCLQTFTSPHDPSDHLQDLAGFQAMSHVRLPAADKERGSDLPDFRIVAGTKKLVFFDQHRVRKDPLTDDLPLRLVILNDVSLTILVVCVRTVKIWDAIRGTLSKTFENVASQDITAVCLDDRRRKFFVGTATGQIACHNYANGARMKRFPAFNDAKPEAAAAEGEQKVIASQRDGNPIVTLQYLWGSKAVIAACAAGTIRVYDEAELEVCRVLRQFDESYAHTELACMSHLEAAQLAATASGAALEGIRLWDSTTTKCEAILKSEGYVVLALGFLEPHPVLYVCSSDGYCRFWVVKAGHKLCGVCLLELPNRPPDGSTYDYYADDGRGTPDELRVAAAVPHSPRPRLLPPVDEHETSELPEGVCRRPVPAAAVAYLADRRMILLGDELGNLRAWDISGLVEVMEQGCPDASYAVHPEKLQLKHDTAKEEEEEEEEVVTPVERVYKHNPAALHQRHMLKPHELPAYVAQANERGDKVVETTRPGFNISDLEPIATPPPHIEALLPTSLVHFAWSVEYAHEDAIVALTSSRDPKSILTSGIDRCVRMWGDEGKFRGLLLQGLPSGSKNACWSVDFDAVERERKENAFTDDIMRQIQTYTAMDTTASPSTSDDEEDPAPLSRTSLDRLAEEIASPSLDESPKKKKQGKAIGPLFTPGSNESSPSSSSSPSPIRLSAKAKRRESQLSRRLSKARATADALSLQHDGVTGALLPDDDASTATPLQTRVRVALADVMSMQTQKEPEPVVVDPLDAAKSDEVSYSSDRSWADKSCATGGSLRSSKKHRLRSSSSHGSLSTAPLPAPLSSRSHLHDVPSRVASVLPNLPDLNLLSPGASAALDRLTNALSASASSNAT